MTTLSESPAAGFIVAYKKQRDTDPDLHIVDVDRGEGAPVHCVVGRKAQRVFGAGQSHA